MRGRGGPKPLMAPVATGVAGLIGVVVGFAVAGLGLGVAGSTGLVSLVTGSASVVGAGSILQAASIMLSCTRWQP